METTQKRTLHNKELQFIFSDFHKFFSFMHVPTIEKQTIGQLKKHLMGSMSDCKLTVTNKKLKAIKQAVEHKLKETVIQPGTSVGVIAAMAIGEKQTQCVLNSFHSAGISLSTLTFGVPRFIEIISATKEQKFSQITFKIKNGRENYKSYKDIHYIIGDSLTCIRMKDLILSTKISNKKEEEIWFDTFLEFFYPTRKYEKDDLTISLCLHKKILYKYRLSMMKIKRKIEQTFENVMVIFSPLHICQLSIIIKKKDMQMDFVKDPYILDNIDSFYKLFYYQIMEPKLEEIHVFGCSKIQGFSVGVEHSTNEFIVSTIGSNLKEILRLPYLKKKDVRSNFMFDIMETSGIEGARQFIFDELQNIVSSDGSFVNKCHLELLADVMTSNGFIQSISRYGIKMQEKSSLFSQSSFEESLEHFARGALMGEKENIESVSASIMVGAHASTLGTGFVKVIPQWENLL